MFIRLFLNRSWIAAEPCVVRGSYKFWQTAPCPLCSSWFFFPLLISFQLNLFSPPPVSHSSRMFLSSRHSLSEETASWQSTVGRERPAHWVRLCRTESRGPSPAKLRSFSTLPLNNCEKKTSRSQEAVRRRTEFLRLKNTFLFWFWPRCSAEPSGAGDGPDETAQRTGPSVE